MQSSMRVMAFCVACCICVLHVSTCHSQTAPAPGFTISGSVFLTGDVYGHSTSLPDLMQARRPANLWRMSFSPVMNFSNAVTIPITLMISSRETNALTPAVGSPSLLQILQNPGNTFNLSVIPTGGWGRLTLGSQSPSYSELSAGDEQVFGAGIDLTPGVFRLAAATGVSQRAIEPDSTRGIRGAYARTLTMAKLGIGGDEGDCLHLNIVKAKDDLGSVTRHPVGVLPQEGLLGSVNFRVGVLNGVTISGEGGISGLTRDLESSPVVNTDIRIPDALLTQRSSTRADFAGSVAVAINQRTWGVKLSSRLIGPGYTSLAWPFLQNDRLEFLIAPRAQFLDRAISVNASIGVRRNNLSETRGTATTQVIGTMDVLARITSAIDLSMRYANFGFRNRMTNDTLKVESVTNSFSIMPGWTITSDDMIHMLSAGWSIDAFTDYNSISGALASNNTNTLSAGYNATLLRIPLTWSLMAMHMTNDMPSGNLSMTGITATLGYSLFEGVLAPSLSYTWSSNAVADFTSDVQNNVRLAVRATLMRTLSLRLSVSHNSYSYGSSHPRGSFGETLFETSLSQKF